MINQPKNMTLPKGEPGARYTVSTLESRNYSVHPLEILPFEGDKFIGMNRMESLTIDLNHMTVHFDWFDVHDIKGWVITMPVVDSRLNFQTTEISKIEPSRDWAMIGIGAGAIILLIVGILRMAGVI